ncbi:MAG: hypothetical protein GY737_16710 [Desulfobacteraceae bacterium]|nr:hypothetical protein [Desulfobacteraceae bacterium]
MMNKRGIILYCMALGITLFVNPCSDDPQQDPSAMATAIRQQYGVSVEEINRVEQLPGSILSRLKHKEVAARLILATKAQYSNYMTILEKALSKYPPGLLAKHLDTIYVGGGYRENGGIVVGLYDKRKLYLFYNHQAGDNSAIFLEQTFHHEFSSILIYAYDFPAFEWLELNPKGFDYIINPVKINRYMNAIRSYHADRVLLEQGLVSSYGKANAENDINTYVELIFTRPQRMRAYVRKYPVTSKKYDMVKHFYLSISQQFDGIFSNIK